jgi:Transposase
MGLVVLGDTASEVVVRGILKLGNERPISANVIGDAQPEYVVLVEAIDDASDSGDVPSDVIILGRSGKSWVIKAVGMYGTEGFGGHRIVDAKSGKVRIDVGGGSIVEATYKGTNELTIKYPPFLAFFEQRVTNGRTEGRNRTIKHVKRLGYGYRSTRNYTLKCRYRARRLTSWTEPAKQPLAASNA